MFRLAVPAALFGTLARTDLHTLANLSIVAFGISTVVVYAAGMLLEPVRLPAPAGRAGHRRDGGRPRQLGEPGPAGDDAGARETASFVTTVIVSQTVVITPILLTALDAANGEERRSHLRYVVTLPVRNPIIIASAAGALCSAFSLGRARRT